MLDIKVFNNKSLAKQSKKGKQVVSAIPATEKAFDLKCDDIVKLFRRNDALKNKIGAYDD